MEATVREMNARLQHRGPDSAGTWADLHGEFAVGHRRLSILDLSEGGHQPMVSADERYVLAYNGEIYNHFELRELLTALGRTFRGAADTEVLLEAISHWGVAGALERASGMFAFAVWDRQERRLTLARDRLGEKPLYYGWSGGTFLFGSELKALRVHRHWKGAVDREALTLYLRHNYVPGPRSIYAGICKLPPGSLIEFGAFTPGVLPDPVVYWSVAANARRPALEPVLSDTDAVDRLEELLGEAVSRQMVADVPLGAFLSGGIDSSTVVALMQAASTRPVRTFTLGVHDPMLDEAPSARAVAAYLKTDHTELYIRPEDALEVIPHLSRIYDEPFADSSQIPTYLISKLARTSVTVSLSGDGGDELFAGYERYVRGPRLQQLLWMIPAAARRQIGRILQSRAVAACFKPLSSHDGGLMGDRAARLGEVMQERSPLGVHRALLTNWISPARIVRNGNEPITAFTAPLECCVGTMAERMLVTDATTYLPDDLLVKVDRAAMAVSLETRVPLLDRKVVEFALRLPWHFKIRGTERKWILRQVLYRHVPRDLIDRPKKGFGVPIGSWLRGPLKPWAERLLDPDRLDAEGFFQVAPITKRWEQHQGGRFDWSYPLWTVLMFQSWLEAERSSDLELKRSG